MNTEPVAHASTAADNNPLTHLLQALRVLYPPSAVVHVGVGRGQGALMQWQSWPELPLAVLIESDANKLQWANQHPPSHWQVMHTTIADSDTSAAFYRASNANEDGLLEPKALRTWLPKLRSMGKDLRPCQTLDSALVKTPCASGMWLLIDCLPAAQLLAHAPITLMRTQVLCLRSAETGPDHPLAHASQAALLALLEPLGFIRLAHTSDETHPALGHTLLARSAPVLPANAPQALNPAPIAPGDHLEPSGATGPLGSDGTENIDADALLYRTLVLADKLAKEEAAHRETVVQLHALLARNQRNAQIGLKPNGAQGMPDNALTQGAETEHAAPTQATETAEATEPTETPNGSDPSAAAQAIDSRDATTTDTNNTTAPAAQPQGDTGTGSDKVIALPCEQPAKPVSVAEATSDLDTQAQAYRSDIAALQAENAALHQRLALLREEINRAEGQINLIKDLMLRGQEL